MTNKISEGWIKTLAWQNIKISPLNMMFTEEEKNEKKEAVKGNPK